MEQLKEYLWTESIPLVFVLAFMAAIEAMAIGPFFILFLDVRSNRKN